MLEWVLRRCDGESCYVESPIGLLPKEDSLNLEGLEEDIDISQLFDIPKDFWLKEVNFDSITVEIF